jgi:hypothetical protein
VSRSNHAGNLETGKPWWKQATRYACSLGAQNTLQSSQPHEREIAVRRRPAVNRTGSSNLRRGHDESGSPLGLPNSFSALSQSRPCGPAAFQGQPAGGATCALGALGGGRVVGRQVAENAKRFGGLGAASRAARASARARSRSSLPSRRRSRSRFSNPEPAVGPVSVPGDDPDAQPFEKTLGVLGDFGDLATNHAAAAIDPGRPPQRPGWQRSAIGSRPPVGLRNRWSSGKR